MWCGFEIFPRTEARAMGWRAASRKQNAVGRRAASRKQNAMGWRAASRKQKWCGRGDSNPHGLSPYGFSYQLRLSPPGPHSRMAARFVVWTIPSPCPRAGFRRCPSSLYTFPYATRGLARDRHLTGFPEFEQFCIPGFPGAHSSHVLKSVASTVPPRPRDRHTYSGGLRHGQAQAVPAPRMPVSGLVLPSAPRRLCRYGERRAGWRHEAAGRAASR